VVLTFASAVAIKVVPFYLLARTQASGHQAGPMLGKRGPVCVVSRAGEILPAVHDPSLMTTGNRIRICSLLFVSLASTVDGKKDSPRCYQLTSNWRETIRNRGRIREIDAAREVFGGRTEET
jgi:hypothetical protein